MPSQSERLASYVPAFIQRRLAAEPQPPTEPAVERFPAAVLFADVSGFTQLARHLAQRGPEGSEELNRTLSEYYGRLVELLNAHGGDVVAYAGDACLVIWPAEENRIAEAISRAAQCSLEIQRRLTNYEAAAGIRISVKICVTAGPVVATEVGGVGDYWQPLVFGPAVDQIRAAEKLAAPGDVVLAPPAFRLLNDDVVGDPLPDSHFRLRGLRRVPAQTPLQTPAVSLPMEMAMRFFMPQLVLSRMDAGHTEWLAEFRQVTAVFLRLGGVDSQHPQVVEQLQAVMQILQTTMIRYEGVVVKLLADDKGTIAILCFGLPLLTHEDDAIRAVRSVSDIRRKLADHGLEADAGLATGRVFCGPLGAPQRREYTILGDVVNLSARLMQRASGEMLCDDATRLATRGKVSFRSLPPVKLKGIDQPVALFAPDTSESASASRSSLIAGRHQERAALTELLQATQRGEARVVLIEGEAGIGKSTLIGFLQSEAPSHSVAMHVGDASAIEKTTPYFAWRDLFSTLLGLQAVSDTAARRQRVLDFLEPQPQLLTLAPLLNTLLNLDLPDNDIVRQLSGRARADNLHDLLLGILNIAARQQPLLIVLEDVQWLDSASWRLVSLVSQRTERVSLALALRPLAPPLPLEFEQLIEHEATTRLTLDVLDREQTLELVRDRLGGGQFAPALADFLYERSQGNPFFADELSRYLREEKLVEQVDGCWRLAASVQQEGRANVPGTIRALITSRIDRLLPPQQLTLKTASVIGRSFPHRTLLDVYPLDADRPRLPEHVDRLSQLKLTEIESLQPELVHMFHHITIQQVTYDQLPLAQRRPLHCSIARWYEGTFPAAPAYYPLLAYHWGKGDDAKKEIEYLTKAGDEALRSFANREAVTFFSQALQRHANMFSHDMPRAQQLRRAHWLRQLGDAHFRLGHLPDGQWHLEQALELMHQPAPSGFFRNTRSTVRQLLIQMLHRLWPSRFTSSRAIDPSEESDGGLYEAALAYQRLSQICYLKVEMSEGLNRALRSLNMSERAGQSPALARSYAGMCLVAGMLRRHRLAERYARLTEDTARRSGHLPTLAYVLMAVCVYRLGVGQWDLVKAEADESVALSERLGDRRQLADSITVLAMLACFRAQYDEAGKLYDRIYEVACKSENVIHQAWGFSGHGECSFRQNKLEQAIEQLQEASRLLEGKEHRTEEIRLQGLLAVSHWRLGRKVSALNFAQDTMEQIANCSYATASTLEAFDGIAEIYLEAWQQTPDSAELRRNARLACAKLRWYAKVFPIGRSRSLCCQGNLCWMTGRKSRARRLWRASLDEAKRFALPLETALAHYEIGRHEPDGSVERQSHLQQAIDRLESLGIEYELRLAREAMLGPTDQKSLADVA
jgi:class 3 adenylate cyclase/tetratricopeptide (TPR) repeat protein